eukprot:TRINITY_DN50761_c0_g1_i1.p1 TRINITY_DN50761_c0_g1~~TRINITY_DN50761_c0_g1_i1.p1  ORF type:complete len:342 (+),score=44.26 TRINITY_DN50761_c0_g1_i1:77-1102(+)
MGAPCAQRAPGCGSYFVLAIILLSAVPSAAKAPRKPKLHPVTAAPAGLVDPTAGNSSGSLHLFILWPSAMQLFSRIVQDLSTRFKVLTTWRFDLPPGEYAEAIWRLYAINVLPVRFQVKLDHCGPPAPFVAILVWDPRPTWFQRVSWNRRSVSGVNAVNAKFLYRGWFSPSNGSQVHATDNMAEAENNCFALLGRTASELAEEPGPPFNPSAAVLLTRRRIPGLMGDWPSCDRLYQAVNVSAFEGFTISPASVSGCRAALRAAQPEITVYLQGRRNPSSVVAMLHGTSPEGHLPRYVPGPHHHLWDEPWHVQIAGTPAVVRVRHTPVLGPPRREATRAKGK